MRLPLASACFQQQRIDIQAEFTDGVCKISTDKAQAIWIETLILDR